MPKITVETEDYNNSFTPVPEGTYPCYLFKVEAKTFSTGSQGYSCSYNIASGKYKGRRIFDNIVLSPSSRWKVAQFWEAMTGQQATTIDTDKFADFVGTLVDARIGIDGDNNRVKSIKYTGKSSQSSAQDDLDGYLAAQDDVPAPVSISDDDLPF